MKDKYQNWLEECKDRISRMQQKSRILSWSRLIDFILMAITFYLGLTTHITYIWISAILLVVFIILIIRQQKAWNLLNYLANRRKALEDEVTASGHGYPFPKGEGYSEAGHAFVNDLDIFGETSLFAMLNRTTSKQGSDKLAQILSNPPQSPDAIKKRQAAVAELSGKPTWLLDFRVYGMQKESSADNPDFSTSHSSAGPKNTKEQPTLFLSAFYKVLVILVPILSLTMIALLSTGMITISAFTWYLLLTLMVPGIFAGKITKKHTKVSRQADSLLSHSKRLQLIEEEKFTAENLLTMQQELRTGGISAGKAIKQLSRIIKSMDARLNWLMWIILNFLLLWDIRQMRRFELWQKEHSQHTTIWFSVLAEMEVLVSKAGFAICNPGYIYPVCTNEPLQVTATNAGHPLINPEKRIDNPIDIKGRGFFNIITGANMAGKSTYLRTTGINLVMAMCGMPVCAETFSFYPAQLITSLHTTDSLSSNKSYFFAELERLKMIIDRLHSGEQLYILLDEILKGTNSHDKQQGSKALLQQLTTLGASGLIATHDLDLGSLEQAYPQFIRNNSFEAEIIDNELFFSYKLQGGIARNMNASFLMKQMGITL